MAKHLRWTYGFYRRNKEGGRLANGYVRTLDKANVEITFVGHGEDNCWGVRLTRAEARLLHRRLGTMLEESR